MNISLEIFLLFSISFKLSNNILYIFNKNSFPTLSVFVELKRMKKSKNKIDDFDVILSLLSTDCSVIISLKISFVNSNNKFKNLLSSFKFEEFLIEFIKHWI